MTDIGKIKRIGIITIAIALLALAADKLYFSDIEWQFRTSKLQKEIDYRQTRANQLLNETEARLVAGRVSGAVLKEETAQSASKDNILLLVYYKNKISYWSDNGVSFQPFYNDSISAKKMVFISNEWFIPVCRKSLDFDIVALIGVGKSYTIENDLLKTGFLKDFKLPESTGMSFDEKSSPFHIYTKDGKFNFAILYPYPKPNTFFNIFPVTLWICFFILLIYLINSATEISSARNKSGSKYAPLLSLVLLASLYAFFLTTNFPGSIYATKLFSPFIYSYGSLIPSIGHLFLLSILLIDFVYIFYRYFPYDGKNEIKTRKETIIAVVLLLMSFVSFALINALFKSIVVDSSVNFEAYKILDISLVSVVGIFSVLLLLVVPILLLIYAYRILNNLTVGAVLMLTFLASFVLFIAYIGGSPIGLGGVIFIYGLSAVVLLWNRSLITLFNSLALFSILAGFYLASVIIKFSDQKDNEAMKVMAVSIANDNDLVAESLLLDLWPSLEADTTLRRLMRRESFAEVDYDAIDKYLLEHYFNGYWDNYDYRSVICFDDSPLNLPLQGSYATNCFLFFDERIKERGSQITGTGFYFINYSMGYASYLTRLYYYVSPFLTTGLFIELISHVEAYQPGYPELLIDKSMQRYPKLKGISYAKYSGENLILRSGDYQYENRLFKVDFKNGEYQLINKDKYKHLLFNRGDMTVVISKQEVTLFDKLITLAYLFIFTLSVVFLVAVAVRKQRIGIFHPDTFRQKLQLSFSAVLIVVFAIVIAASLFVSISRFAINHSKTISEKIKSVALALELDMSQENSSDKGWTSADIPALNSQLVKLSNVFLSDINIYSPAGEIIATSRPEIFKKQLEGTRINAEAFYEMLVNRKMEYIHEERLGNLKYLSAYMPLFNSDRSRLLGYLNLPYFQMQDLLAGEISSLVVSVINFTFLFMMIMMWVAVFISDRLTSPLQLLQRAMASVELGKKSEHIHYRSNDEVGEMVRQYNRMIDELDDSAKKLTRSEREMAWREMARQIAHEIKNPLTPMKLNVQQLLRWWKDGTPDFNNRIESFTGNQIEYIDNLSSIATAFSNFARLPAAEPSEVDLLVQMSRTIELFAQTEGVKIILDTGNLSKVVMMADKEHLNGIFSNLIKNAIQAIPSGKFGVIRITVSGSFDKTLITIRDNGCGIPEELKSKLFTPNFTTKSSGMGLGLSIVKRYVESAGGQIWFESYQDKGTTFFIELPIIYTVEKLNGNGAVEK